MPSLRELYQQSADTDVAKTVPKVWVVLARWTPTRQRGALESYETERVKILGTFDTLELAKSSAEFFVNDTLEKIKDRQVRSTHGLGHTNRENKIEEHDDGTVKWTVYPPDGFCRTVVEILEQSVQDEIWTKDHGPMVITYNADPIDCDCSYDGSEHKPTQLACLAASRIVTERALAADPQLAATFRPLGP